MGSYGVEVLTTDRNDIGALLKTFSCHTVKDGRPHQIIVNTIKGKGVSFMGNDAKWHIGFNIITIS